MDDFIYMKSPEEQIHRNKKYISGCLEGKQAGERWEEDLESDI